MVNNENIKIRFNKYLSKALYVKGGYDEVIKYNFTMVEGTTKYLRFSVYDDETGKRKDLSDCSIEFYLVNGNTEVKKDILVSSEDTHIIQVKITPDDTIGQRYYNYQLLLTEPEGDITQLVTGTVTIENSISLHDPRRSVLGTNNMANGDYVANQDGTVTIGLDGGEL